MTSHPYRSTARVPSRSELLILVLVVLGVLYYLTFLVIGLDQIVDAHREPTRVTPATAGPAVIFEEDTDG